MFKEAVFAIRRVIHNKLPTDGRYDAFTELWLRVGKESDHEKMCQFFGVEKIDELQPNAIINYVQRNHVCKPFTWVTQIKLCFSNKGKGK